MKNACWHFLNAFINTIIAEMCHHKNSYGFSCNLAQVHPKNVADVCLQVDFHRNLLCILTGSGYRNLLNAPRSYSVLALSEDLILYSIFYDSISTTAYMICIYIYMHVFYRNH